MHKFNKFTERMIAKIAKENPDLSYQFIKSILVGLEEVENNFISEYKFG